jgi:tetratricopeptide (TPR) repeat protein
MTDIQVQKKEVTKEEAKELKVKKEEPKEPKKERDHHRILLLWNECERLSVDDHFSSDMYNVCTQLIGLDPIGSASYYIRRSGVSKSTNPQSALLDLKFAMELKDSAYLNGKWNESRSHVRLYMAHVYFLQKKSENMISCLSDLINSIDTDLTILIAQKKHLLCTAHRHRARVYWENGDIDKADSDMNTMISFYPDHVQNLRLYGTFLRATGNNVKAQEVHKKANRIDRIGDDDSANDRWTNDRWRARSPSRSGSRSRSPVRSRSAKRSPSRKHKKKRSRSPPQSRSPPPRETSKEKPKPPRLDEKIPFYTNWTEQEVGKWLYNFGKSFHSYERLAISNRLDGFTLQILVDTNNFKDAAELLKCMGILNLLHQRQIFDRICQNKK